MSMGHCRITPFGILRLVAAIAVTAFASAAPSTPEPADFAGSWHGALAVGETRLRLVFHVTAGDDGGLEATLDSPDQGAYGIAVSGVSVEGDSLKLEIGSIGAAFEGRLDEAHDALEGDWQQAGRSFSLTVERENSAEESGGSEAGSP